MQASGITITLNSLIQNLNMEKLQIEGSLIMSQILLDERWQSVAFLAVYDKEGRVVLHSNPSLIGKKFNEIEALFEKESPYYQRVVLGTGEEVFLSDTRININQNQYILRVALHLYPAETPLRVSKIYLTFIFLSAFIVILAGITTVLIFGKIEKMQIKMRELENLSILSRILAHEIRNPLGSIKGFAQYLFKKVSDKSLKEYLDIIIKESMRLERLTNELSMYANPENITLEEVNLKEVINDVLLPFITQNQEVRFIRKLEDLYLKTDADKLKQILNNIIQNSIDALKNSKDKKITVMAYKTNGKIKIEIEDTGIGMDEETLKRALEPFFTTKTKGTGLGLAIVDRLCELLKIDLQIKSKKGQGTKICLIIPE
ncbi:MAG: ATP-binding protein [Thermodesulfovibrio sp.]|nr:ATP-binding protein [Thermodesulfovibrio sp.]MCX7724989.1 ATP-binding protein [Thermodesulfovibrio sp.]MDW7971795.1 ATP-binding protein [Thermodesulfovibrio sp.]